MESLYLLIPIASLLVVIGILIFIWAVKSEQFEDLERHGMNILFDDDHQEKLEPSKPKKKKRKI